MMQSMYSGISGLQNFQNQMDVVGNNIANVNTVGFKAQRADFATLFSQTLAGASSPTATQGGTNPVQVGLGVTLAGTGTNMTQGSLQETGQPTDVGIQGQGFFIVQTGQGQAFTRAGNFSVDAKGQLTTPAGALVQGWQASSAGTLPTQDAAHLTGITIPQGATSPATATANVAFGGNLQAGTATTSPYVTEVDVYDSLGNLIPVTVTFTPSGTNAWSWKATVPASGTSTTPTTVGTGSLSFTASGQINTTSTSGTLSITPTDGASALSIKVDFSQLTQFASASTASENSVDGNAAGTLQTYAIDPAGAVTGVFSNGQRQLLGQIALAGFENPLGLQSSGANLYTVSNNSGSPQVGVAGTGKLGSLAPGTLEMSNVDLSQEFTNMITAERAFQANAQVITISDTMLQSLDQMVQ